LSDYPLPAFDELTADQRETVTSTIGVTAAIEILASLGCRVTSGQIIGFGRERGYCYQVAGVARFRIEDLHTIAMQLAYERRMRGQAD
jgi:hypothetical protein